MPTIHDAYINALLADATYALNRNIDNLSGPDLIQALTPRMTLAQATYIADNFTMVTHTDEDDIFGGGFDATVWQGKVGTAYEGKTYVSMTGTEGLAHFVVDANLGLYGAPRKQALYSRTGEKISSFGARAHPTHNVLRTPMTISSHHA